MPWIFNSETGEFKAKELPFVSVVWLVGFTLYHFSPEELSLRKEVLRMEEARVEVLAGITKEKTHRVIF